MAAAKPIKLVIWDLDNTLWAGTLAEGDAVAVFPAARAAVREFDRRGILQSIASRNEHADAWRILQREELAEYFLEPRIDWADKSVAVGAIVEALNIGFDTVAFIDDQPFERAEVAQVHPAVRCYDSTGVAALPGDPAFDPPVTVESARRRAMYIEDRERDAADRAAANKEAFAQSLDLRVAIEVADAADLQRIEELTVRTSQLNASGYIYRQEELLAFAESPDHILLSIEASDRFGAYGKIGAALIEVRDDRWILKLLIVSCRVMSRGIGGMFLWSICRRAAELGLPLFAEFKQTDRNRAMLIALRFSGFVAAGSLADGGCLMRREGPLAAPPTHVRLRTPWPDMVDA